MDRNGTSYTLVFTLVVCAICSAFVAGAYELLGERQRADAAVLRMLDILQLTGLAAPDEALSRDEILARFQGIRPVAVDLRSGRVDPALDGTLHNQREAANDPARSREAPANPAGVRRLPDHAVVYERLAADGSLDQVLLPIHGQGYGGQIYGFLALGADLNTVRDIVFYEHEETPTLGGKINRASWRSAWAGRRIYDESGAVALQLVSDAGPAQTDPFRVDAVSRASVTTAGVQHMIDFWLGPDGFGPFLSSYRETLAGAAGPSGDR